MKCFPGAMDSEKIGKIAKGVCVCQACFIFLGGIVGCIAHFQVLTGAKHVYLQKVECGITVGRRERECTEVTTELKDQLFQNNVVKSQAELHDYTSDDNQICLKSGDELKTSAEDTCGKTLLGCQIWVLEDTGRASAEVKTDLVMNAQLAQATIVQKKTVGPGREKTELDARCGLTNDGLLDLQLVYEKNITTDASMTPPIPRPFVWMVYKLIGLDAMTVDWFFSRLACGNGLGRFAFLMKFFPFLPGFSKKVSPVVSYLKFSVVPLLMLSILTSMTGVACDGNSECEKNTEKILVSHAGELGAATYVYIGVIGHFFALLIVYALMSWKRIYSGSDEEVAFENLTKIGKALLFFLALCDVGVLGFAVFAVVSTLAKSSVTFGLGFTASFAFDLKAAVSVDIFQIIAILLFMMETLHRIAKVVKGIRDAVTGQAEELPK